MDDRRLRGLLVDWGGVLTNPLEPSITGWAGADGVDLAHYREVMRGWVVRDPAASGTPGTPPEPAPAAGVADSPVHRLERGELSPAEFELALAAELAERGSPVRADGLLRRMLAGLESTDRAMLAAVGEARRSGIRTALLSNSWGDHYPDELFGGVFDVVVISGRVGMRKPEPQIYRHTADLLGLTPPECVMVDDLPHNVRGAVAVGMVGVLHEDRDRTLLELEALFGRPLRV